MRQLQNIREESQAQSDSVVTEVPQAASPIANHEETEAIDNIKYYGLGGWLIVFLVHMFYYLVGDIIGLFSGLAQSNHMMVTLTLMFLAIEISVIALFFSRHQLFPMLAIGLEGLVLCISASAILEGSEIDFMNGIFKPAIWITYLLLSNRVASTFGKVAPEELNASSLREVARLSKAS